MKTWKKIRADGALHGYVKCTDGRLYHRVVAEKAREAWSKKQAQRDRTEAARLAKLAKQRGISDEGTPSGTQQDRAGDYARNLSQKFSDSVTEPVTDQVTNSVTNSVTEPVTGSKGEEKRGEDKEKEDNSDLRSAPARPSPDPKATLWRKGLAVLMRLTGKPETAARKLLGNLSDVAKHDHGALLSLIQRAEAEPLDDPFAWLMAGAKALTGQCAPASLLDGLADDGPWGIDAWIARQPDIRMEPDGATGRMEVTLNGHGVLYHASRVAEAAGLPEGWGGSWDPFGNWLRENLEITRNTLEAIRSKAQWMRSKGETVRSIALFDDLVRSSVRVPA